MRPDEFLAWEREQTERHAYLGGEIVAMSGGSLRHAHLAVRAIAAMHIGVAGRRCDVYTADLRIGLGDQFVYADAVVVCRPPEFRPGTKDVVTNPTIVVEVLSKFTEVYDRGAKQAGYLALPSLAHLVFVSQRAPRVEVYTRQDDGSFRFTVHGPGSVVVLDRIGLELVVDDLYGGAFELPGDEA
jgi:Uma2 family endonuclease